MTTQHEISSTDLFSADDKLLALARAIGSIAVMVTGKVPKVKIVNANGDFVWMQMQPDSNDDFVCWD